LGSYIALGAVFFFGGLLLAVCSFKRFGDAVNIALNGERYGGLSCVFWFCALLRSACLAFVFAPYGLNLRG
jgi:hypothetical protein